MLGWATPRLPRVARRYGCGVIMEHPADSGPPHPSTWVTSGLGPLADEGDLEVVEFDQFWLGAGSRKLLRLASSSPEAACWGQPHRRHFTQPPLIGQEVDGAFGGKDTPAHLGGVCPDPALLHPRESCRHPAREDRIGLSLTEL